jgi:hypothetical protein
MAQRRRARRAAHGSVAMASRASRKALLANVVVETPNVFPRPDDTPTRTDRAHPHAHTCTAHHFRATRACPPPRPHLHHSTLTPSLVVRHRIWPMCTACGTRARATRTASTSPRLRHHRFRACHSRPPTITSRSTSRPSASTSNMPPLCHPYHPPRVTAPSASMTPPAELRPAADLHAPARESHRSFSLSPACARRCTASSTLHRLVDAAA